MVTTVSETDGLVLLKGGQVIYSSPELAGRVCDCAQAAGCCGVWTELREAAVACEAGSAEAVGSAGVTLVEGSRRRRLEFVLRKATVDGAPLVVATVRAHAHVGRDTLTALANRATLSEHLTATLAQSALPLAVVMIDLDDFKQVNDTAGHLTGDRVLSLAAQRLVGVVRGSDLVARLGGDEFVVVLHDVRSEREVAAFAQRLSAAVGRPYVIGERRFTLGCSVGAAFSPRDGSTPEQLLQRADAAMYLAKRAGKNRYRSWAEADGLESVEPVAMLVHSPAIPRIGFAQVDDAHDHLHALARSAVELVLQPGGLERGEWRAPTEALLASAALHFLEEEAHLAGRPTLRAHRQAHRVFLAQVEHALNSEWPIAATSVVTLADALADHIATHDVELCPEPPEEGAVALAG
jgi:diguanylate cyclase (GGDEF)-like protein